MNSAFQGVAPSKKTRWSINLEATTSDRAMLGSTEATRLVWRPGVEEDDGSSGGIELSEAIEALRRALVRAWLDSQGQRVRFKVEPVELVVQVGVTRAGKGSAGVRWHVISIGGELSRESVSTQTLTLRLDPVLFDEQGNVLAEAEQLISDRESPSGATARDEPSHEPA